MVEPFRLGATLVLLGRNMVVLCIHAKNCTQTPTSDNIAQLSKKEAEVSTY
jgi:hypothetical protein